MLTICLSLRQICDLKQPFDGYTHTQMRKVYSGKERPKIAKSCPDQIKELLPRTWDQNIAKRPELEEVIEVVGKVITDMCGDSYLLDVTNRTALSYDRGNR